jgi:hypothetical protein
MHASVSAPDTQQAVAWRNLVAEGAANLRRRKRLRQPRKEKERETLQVSERETRRGCCAHQVRRTICPLLQSSR